MWNNEPLKFNPLVDYTLTEVQKKAIELINSPLNEQLKWSSYEDYWTDFLRNRRVMPEIKNVIFNNPATIVLWKDGTKTVVKCGDMDIYDPEKGLAMAIAKKVMGNKGNYYNEIRKWLNEEGE